MMLNDQNLIEDAGQIEAKPKSGFRAIWILWGCGGMVLLLVLLLGGCFVAAKSAMKVGEREFSPAVEQYLSQVAQKNYHSAYAGFDESMKKTVSEEDYTAMDIGLHQHLGALKTKNVQFVQAGVFNGTRWGRIIYEAQFEKGPGTIRFELRKVGVEYKLTGFNYNSPVLAEVFKSKQP